jgi:hypothetical protein
MARLLTRTLLVGTFLIGTGILVGCGPTTPVPKRGSHGDKEEFTLVSRPPEAVEVQMLGARPDDRAVWIDGHWHWSGRRWVWQDGMWAHAPEGGHYAPPELVRLPVARRQQEEGDYGAVLLYRPGHWHLADGGVAPVVPIEE